MLSNYADKTILTIYAVPKFVTELFLIAQTNLSIVKGYRKNGIFAYNANIFSSSFVTDSPNLETVNLEKDRIEQATISNNEPEPT